MKRPNPIDLGRLRDEVEQLESACHAYDRETLSRAVCTNIATISLRKLLYDRGSNNVSVLTHLGVKPEMAFYDASLPRLTSECAIVPHCGLAGHGPNGHVANLDWDTKDVAHRRMLPFNEWWDCPVVWDAKDREFSRSDIVMIAADKDGGAHLDALLPEDYSDLVSENSLGRGIGVGGSWEQLGSPVPACVRHISHELLVSIAIALPVAFRSKYRAHALASTLHIPDGGGLLIGGFAVHGTPLDDSQADK